jgi:hypothetical protein
MRSAVSLAVVLVLLAVGSWTVGSANWVSTVLLNNSSYPASVLLTRGFYSWQIPPLRLAMHP